MPKPPSIYPFVSGCVSWVTQQDPTARMFASIGQRRSLYTHTDAVCLAYRATPWSQNIQPSGTYRRIGRAFAQYRIAPTADREKRDRLIAPLHRRRQPFVRRSEYCCVMHAEDPGRRSLALQARADSRLPPSNEVPCHPGHTPTTFFSPEPPRPLGDRRGRELLQRGLVRPTPVSKIACSRRACGRGILSGS